MAIPAEASILGTTTHVTGALWIVAAFLFLQGLKRLQRPDTARRGNLLSATGMLIADEALHAHRSRALSPDHPTIRGTAQNPDVYFQARESVNPFYLACPEHVRKGASTVAQTS